MINEDIFKNFYYPWFDVFLFCACNSGNKHSAKFLIKYGENVNEENKYEESPLFYACNSGNEKIVKYLIEHGSYIYKRNGWRKTPLYIACKNGNEGEGIKCLIEHGADINEK